ncbi:MAG: alanine--tRNA ligase [Ardenticatenaceae bacterium]|nr:alanine--tRNA ligase [Anaerolineales bacterium]MCB8920140.1 alanine--tRNA ligase [Ardenticatenaceae bacterium]MCB9005065.1 alanine--tRNA ligase [Ardenticatenaceae bacterium]
MKQPKTSNELRQAFLNFFNERGHEIVASAILPQQDNPTLLFTNAGMNQFVDVFLGKEKRAYSRATTSQKCMRVQGKHNDLENVGPSPRHHTFFEMLGNFSFGDYFKQDAIRYAYDFLTKTCAIPPDKLYFTVHTSDDEAYHIWANEIGAPADHILRMGDKTNFWSMGDTGPCGPTSELHYDWGPEACTCGQPDCSVLLDNDCDRWLEVWNLVFMQFDQAADGTRTLLPKPGVDTGMGLERITSVVQQTPVNYDNDLFSPAMDMVQELLGDQDADRQQKYVGYRVIADHGRAATFMIADGVRPGSTGAGYVLRMVIRRAARFGRKIGFTEPFLAHVAGVFIDQMGNAYPELKQRREHILRTLTREEEKFARTVDSGLAQLDKIIAELGERGETEVSGDTAFNLYATYGLPLEITRDVVKELGLTVDEPGFVRARDAHAEASGAGRFGQYETGTNVYADALHELMISGTLEEGVEYDPYLGANSESEVVAIFRDGQQVDALETGETGEVVTAVTPFYVEAGGEVSDTGMILCKGGQFRVEDTRKPVNGLVVHIGTVEDGRITLGGQVHLRVDNGRRWDIRRNHTATHILHKELRAHLGTHVQQAGSLVAPDRLRFDFTHDQGVDKETLAEIEAHINKVILANRPITITYMSQKEAVEAGAMALFGEKYGDVVRTIKIGDPNHPYSYELCGGLHVNETAEIGSFRFLSEGAVSAGVRRVEAVTGRGAAEYVAGRLDTLERVAGRLNAPIPELETRLETLLTEHRSLQKELEKLQRQAAKGQFDNLLAQVRQVNGANVLAARVDVPNADALREMADWFRDKVGSGTAVFGTVVNDKPLIIATVTDDLIKRGVKAGDLVREVAKMVGGGGGGRPNMAQAGGRDASKLAAALDAVAGLVEKALD